jgi:hypothetical protein
MPETTPAARRTALVTGASGLAGGYVLAHLLEQGGWDIVTVSRRKPQIRGDYKYMAVDLLDPADCRAKLGPLTNISHLFYLAITERTDPAETTWANANMFFDLAKTVEAASPALEHVHLPQGTRWYENHLGPYKTPTKEDDPRRGSPSATGTPGVDAISAGGRRSGLNTRRARTAAIHSLVWSGAASCAAVAAAARGCGAIRVSGEANAPSSQASVATSPTARAGRIAGAVRITSHLLAALRGTPTG